MGYTPLVVKNRIESKIPGRLKGRKLLGFGALAFVAACTPLDGRTPSSPVTPGGEPTIPAVTQIACDPADTDIKTVEKCINIIFEGKPKTPIK